MARYKIPEPKKKTAGEQVKDTIIYLIAVTVIYYVIVTIVRVIIAPFKILFMSDRQKFEARLGKAKAKVIARDLYRAAYDTSEANPLYQYLKRFKYSPEQFTNDPDNETYRLWFEDLRNGTLLDTELNWAPEVYVKALNESSMYNEDFLDYFSRQFDLHKDADLRIKLKFMRTIQKFYPEFTPRFSVIPGEIKDFYSRLQAKKLHNELLEVISGSGVPLDLAEGIVDTSMSPTELKGAIRLILNCQARKYSKIMCQFCVKHNFNPNQHEDYFSDAVNSILEHTENESIALALIRGDIGPEEVEGIVKKAMASDFDSREEFLGNVNQEFFKVMKSKTVGQLIRG